MPDQIVVVVTGCRDWSNRSLIEKALQKTVQGFREAVLFHGDCETGADPLAADVGKELGMDVKPFPADWDTHPRAAGPIRNKEMCQSARTLANLTHSRVVCLAFWDGISTGTGGCVAIAAQFGIPVKIYPRW